MKNKIIIFGLMLLILITCSAGVFAEDNNTLATSVSEVDEVMHEKVSDEVSSSEITITDDNYDNYFNKYTGKMKDSVDSSVDTIKIGNVSNKAFTIDRPLNIMPVSSDCEISNGVIHLIEGSSGSNITNLIINNTKGDLYQDGLFVTKLHGIWFSNSSDNLIFNNTIRIPGAEGCYAMPMGYSNRNRILYNDIVSTFTSCILMGSCNYNNISYNRAQILTVHKKMVAANIIYINPFGHADYSGPADSIGTYISNNYFINSDANSMNEYTINVLGQSNYTIIVNNTIVHGDRGINVYDEWSRGVEAKNILIHNNTVINATWSIYASNYDVTVSNNKIIGSSMDLGILIAGGKNHDNATVCNNEIIYNDLSNAIALWDGANVFNNTVILSRYGIGIGIGGNNSNVSDNYIQVRGDDGINIGSSHVTISNNVIHTKARGIVSKETNSPKYKIINNNIYGNEIYSDDFAVYVEGYVYNTTISNNYVETNRSNAFYIDMYTTLTDSNPGEISDNTINGVIKDTEILVIDDSNFYDYFNSGGYLTYNFKTDSQRILFLTFLTNKNLYFTDPITLTSNKQANLLYNVTITLKEDASDSTIKDFKFFSFDKESIILDGVENVVVKNNEFTTLTNDIFESKTISVIGGCNLCNITDNTIFINSKADFTYAFCVSEPQRSLIKRFSGNFTISNNNILIKSNGVAEAMYFDALVESKIVSNKINIVSDGSAYGISVCDVFGRPYDITMELNKIIVNSNEMSYLIELYRADDCLITNNYLKGTSNGVYALGLYNSSSKVNGNEFIVIGKNLTNEIASDALGKGNVAVYMTKQSIIDNFENNIIDSQNCHIITKQNSEILKIKSNSFVIGNYNYDLYFDGSGKLNNEIIGNGDKILFKNFTDSKEMDIDVSVMIRPYSHLNDFKAVLVFSNGSDKSSIAGFNFNGAIISLDNVSDILIFLNNFTDSKIKNNWSVGNKISNNTFASGDIEFINCSNDIFEFNSVNINSRNSKFIIIKNSNDINIFSNYFDVKGDSIKLITSDSSNSTNISDNKINIISSGDIKVYFANNALFDDIFSNIIGVNATGMPTAIQYNNSSDNIIKFNIIISYSTYGQDWAIFIEGENNTVMNNYLISSNGYKRGDDAVNATNNMVRDNVPVVVYVSINGTEDGNGTFENPYPTIKKAIENSLSGAIINILPGMYNESDITIDKNITLTAINLEGNTYINALGNQLFTINENGTLTVNALKIFNGFCVEGGALFYNLGNLLINNSLIYNSSSYYNNSNPTFSYKNKWDKYNMYSQDCSNLGVGGAILNRGELLINSSTLYDNFAHKGGAIADFGKTTIKNSLICNNTGVHGGAIYTNSKNELIIDNSEFRDNLAIQTLDYCYIKKIIYAEYPNMAGLRYRYLPNCDVLPGMGGAIFSNSVLNINNSLFNHNAAKYGGAIAYDSNILTNQNYYHDELDYRGKGGQIKYSPTSILNIENSLFSDNEAKNTSCGNLSRLVDDPYGGRLYTIHAEGGAIFGALKEFNVYNSTFVHNLAESNGGAMCVQSLNSSIEASMFCENTAGISGGGLDIFGNFEIFNTEIVNNSAKIGGALEYNSYSSYNHVQNNIGMFNVTVSGNRALDYGGAFSLGIANFAIKNSNIYDNSAPTGSTFSGKHGISSGANIDARGNWWGSIDGPDDSVFMQTNIRFRTWAGQKIDWSPIKINGGSDSSDAGRHGNGQPQKINGPSTGSAIHTGSTLTVDVPSSSGGHDGFNFNGNWPSGRNNGNYNGNFGDGNGVSPFDSSGDSKTDVNGNVMNPSSLSKTNSSSVNDLASVGMTANAADASSSSQSSSGEGGSGEAGNAYEITKEVKKEIIDDKNLSMFNILFILLWIFLFIGFYRKYREDENI